MWNLPGPGIEPVSPALAGGFFITEPPGKAVDFWIVKGLGHRTSPCFYSWFFFWIFSGLDESILEECLQYLEKQLESSQARKAMEDFFSDRWAVLCSPQCRFLNAFQKQGLCWPGCSPRKYKSLLWCLYFREDWLTAGTLKLLVKGVVFDSLALLTHRWSVLEGMRLWGNRKVRFLCDT